MAQKILYVSWKIQKINGIHVEFWNLFKLLPAATGTSMLIKMSWNWLGVAFDVASRSSMLSGILKEIKNIYGNRLLMPIEWSAQYPILRRSL